MRNLIIVLQLSPPCATVTIYHAQEPFNSAFNVRPVLAGRTPFSTHSPRGIPEPPDRSFTQHVPYRLISQAARHENTPDQATRVLRVGEDRPTPAVPRRRLVLYSRSLSLNAVMLECKAVHVCSAGPPSRARLVEDRPARPGPRSRLLADPSLHPPPRPSRTQRGGLLVARGPSSTSTSAPPRDVRTRSTRRDRGLSARFGGDA